MYERMARGWGEGGLSRVNSKTIEVVIEIDKF